MQISNLLVIFLLCFISCSSDKQEQQEEKFDKTKWATKEDKIYPYRDRMLKDLVYNQKLKGLKRDEVLNLLGQPTRIDSNYLFYIVSQSFIGDLVPLHTKSLVIKLINDTVEWRKIKE